MLIILGEERVTNQCHEQTVCVQCVLSLHFSVSRAMYIHTHGECVVSLSCSCFSHSVLLSHILQVELWKQNYLKSAFDFSLALFSISITFKFNALLELRKLKASLVSVNLKKIFGYSGDCKTCLCLVCLISSIGAL